MSRTGRALAVATVALAVGLTSAACGADDGESDSITQSTSSAAEPTSEPAETSTSSPAPTSGATSASSSGASSTDDGGVLDEEDEGRQLGLDDYFMADSQWEERRYDLADRQDVQGVGTAVSSCGANSSFTRELELRLGNNFSELTFSAAQANDSQDSDQSLVVEIVANNEQRDIRSVPFNQIQEFTLDVDGVNALVIRLYLDDAVDGCGGSVVGVITGATVN